MTTTAKSRPKIDLLGDTPPTRTAITPILYVIWAGEIVGMWQLIRLSDAWWITALGWVLLALSALLLLLRPYIQRKGFALSTGRWRALRRISRIEAADLTEFAPTDLAERLSWTTGVAAATARIADICAEEQTRVAKEFGDTK